MSEYVKSSDKDISQGKIMKYRKNMFALLVAGTLITGCGGGGTDISGGSSGGSTGGTTVAAQGLGQLSLLDPLLRL